MSNEKEINIIHGTEIWKKSSVMLRILAAHLLSYAKKFSLMGIARRWKLIGFERIFLLVHSFFLERSSSTKAIQSPISLIAFYKLFWLKKIFDKNEMIRKQRLVLKFQSCATEDCLFDGFDCMEEWNRTCQDRDECISVSLPSTL